MYGESGHCYVYLCYGIHWLLNVVTGAMGYPAAVLIRGSEDHLGPGILTKALGVDGSFNGTLLSPKNRLWIEPREARMNPRLEVVQELELIMLESIGQKFLIDFGFQKDNLSLML